MAAAAQRKALHAAIDQVAKDAAAVDPERTDKLEQLASALGTAHMVVDDLFDTVKYVPTHD